MSEKKPKVIKKEEKEAVAEYQRRHEKSLLKLLAEKYPEDAVKFAVAFNRKKNGTIEIYEASLVGNLS